MKVLGKLLEEAKIGAYIRSIETPVEGVLYTNSKVSVVSHSIDGIEILPNDPKYKRVIIKSLEKALLLEKFEKEFGNKKDAEKAIEKIQEDLVEPWTEAQFLKKYINEILEALKELNKKNDESFDIDTLIDLADEAVLEIEEYKLFGGDDE